MVKQVSYIKDSKSQDYPLIVGFISEVGEVKSGNKRDGGTYQKQDCVITDNSDSTTLTLWGEDCNTLQLHDYVEVDGVTKVFEGNYGIQKTKFGHIKKVTADDILPRKDESPDVDLNSNEVTSDGPPSTPQPTTVVSNKLNDTLDEALEFAKKITHAYIDAMKEKGTESPEGCSAVWNTALIRFWR